MKARVRRARPLPQNRIPPLVVEVRGGSPCEGKVRPGDLLLEINGSVPLDILDYMEACGEGRVSLRLIRDGKRIERKIVRNPGVPPGLVFDSPVFDGVRTCRNHCIFCFVDQMPRGLRPTLYVKDDDYRLSFYHGNFITLNNLSREDLERIVRLRLSPLYVSLHSSDPVLRRHMMGGDAGRGLTVLGSLLREGVEVHLQVVVCPGVNDGGELRRTLRFALDTRGALSLAVVPVGLTSQAHALRHSLTPHDRGSAAEVLEAVAEFQELALGERGERIFFAADEFYLLAGRDFPPAQEYDDYPQLENGVGMARKFLQEAREAAALRAPQVAARRAIVTGTAGAGVIRLALREAGLHGVEVIAARSLLFGPAATVTALLGGADIIAALREKNPSSRELIFPDSMLREGHFIDDLTPADVERQTGYSLSAVAVEGRAFLRALAGEEGGG